MNMFKVVLTCFGLAWFLSTTTALRCLDCRGLSQPLDCTTVVECGRHERCSMRQYNTNDGIILYDVGCTDASHCHSHLIPVGKRHDTPKPLEDLTRSTGTTICYACCNDRDICNQDHYCGSQTFKPPTGSRLCYSCQKTTKPDNCNQITLCDQDSLCSVKEVINLLGGSRWELGCALNTQCLAHSKRSSRNFCSNCCSGDLCNRNCSNTTTTISPPTTPTTITTTLAPKIPPTGTSVIVHPQHPKYGDTVTITCQASGTPPLKYDYLLKGMVLPPNVHTDNNQHNILTIVHYLPSNDALYRCVVSNAYGDDHKQFQLQGH